MAFNQYRFWVYWVLAFLYVQGAQAQAQSSTQNPSQPAATADSNLSDTHIFGGDNNIQGMHQQYALATARGPLPFGVTASVQKWVTGPPLDNLYTQIAQGYVPVNDKLKFVFSEMYQKQGNIDLANLVVGASYKATNDLSINATTGVGINTLYTYRYSLYLSPQYTLPFERHGQKLFSIEAGLNYQNYELGEFGQITPKLNWHVSDTVPLISAAYAFGDFRNTTDTVQTGYYQPKTLRGAMFTTVFKPAEKAFLALTWYPANSNYIAGAQVIQDTVGATLHYNLSQQIRFSVFSQFQVTRGSGNDVAFGASASFNF